MIYLPPIKERLRRSGMCCRCDMPLGASQLPRLSTVERLVRYACRSGERIDRPEWWHGRRDNSTRGSKPQDEARHEGTGNGRDRPGLDETARSLKLGRGRAETWKVG